MAAALWTLATTPDTWATPLALTGIATVLAGLLSARDRRHH